jgi:predicted hydrocarbon binding protein
MTATRPRTEATLAGGNFYDEGSYAKTDVRRGVTRSRAGVRLVCLTSDFLVGFRRAIIDETGPAADVVFKSIGKKWGGFIAKRFETEMTSFHNQPLREFPLAKFRAVLADMLNHHGWGRVNVDFSKHDQGLMSVSVQEPIFATLLSKDEKPTKPVESLMCGLFAGLFSELFGQDLDAVQTKCKACGADSSVFLLGLTARLAGVPAWQEAGKSHDQILRELANVRV